MAEAKTVSYSALSKKTVEVPAYSVYTVEYMDTLPNYFNVQNMGATPIYCGTSSIPTRSKYDFVSPAEGMKMYAEPYNRSRLYLFNPSGTPITCAILSFRAPFDPLTLAMSSIAVTIDTSDLQVSNIITGFNASLPTGSNNIGKVEVSNQKDYSSALASILSEISGNSPAWTADDVSSLLTRVFHPAKEVLRREQMHTYTQEGTATNSGTAITPQSGRFFSKINFISNDGTSDLSFIYTDKNATKSITIKAGEVLNDLECYFTQIKFTGDNVPFRCLYTTEPVSITV